MWGRVINIVQPVNFRSYQLCALKREFRRQGILLLEAKPEIIGMSNKERTQGLRRRGSGDCGTLGRGRWLSLVAVRRTWQPRDSDERSTEKARSPCRESWRLVITSLYLSFSDLNHLTTLGLAAVR